MDKLFRAAAIRWPYAINWLSYYWKPGLPIIRRTSLETISGQDFLENLTFPRRCWNTGGWVERSNGITRSSSFSTDAGACQQRSSQLRKSALTVEQALYLAKEVGLYTTAEIQQQIIKSPSFSPDNSPFVIENFFDTGEKDPELEVGETQESRQDVDLALNPTELESPTTNTTSITTPKTMADQVHPMIHNTLVSAFNPKWLKTFWLNGREWLTEAEGVGTRKRATAHAHLRRGTGQVLVNEGEDVYLRWPYYYNRMDVLQPFYLTGTAGEFDLFIDARGGGVSGQAGAVRLAVGRALLAACPACAKDLEDDIVLYEDTRQKLPKMPGRYKARTARKWSKR